MKLKNPIVSIDGLELKEFDYIDIGAILDTSGAVPVVIKSLIFPTTAGVGKDWQGGADGRRPARDDTELATRSSTIFALHNEQAICAESRQQCLPDYPYFSLFTNQSEILIYVDPRHGIHLAVYDLRVRFAPAAATSTLPGVPSTTTIEGDELMDYVKPADVATAMVETGSRKLALAPPDLLIRGMLSGAILGVATSLAFTGAVQTNVPLVGALIFPVGLIIIVLLGLELITGSFALVPLPWLEREASGCAR